MKINTKFLVVFLITILTGCTVSDKVVNEDTESEEVINSLIISDETLLSEDAIGSFYLSIKNGGYYEDEIDNIVLAGTSSVALAELEASIDEDGEVENIIFSIVGDFSNTIDNPRFFLSEQLFIADVGFVYYDSAEDKTYITFENDFTFEKLFEEVNFLLIADINSYTDEGGETSAKLGDISIEIDSVEVYSVDSNKEMPVDLSDSETSDAITIVPVLVTVSVEDEFGEDDDDAVINFNLDKGDNEFYNDDVFIYSIELESYLEESVEIRNDDDIFLLTSSEKTINFFEQAIDRNLLIVKDGDEYEFTLSTHDEIRIRKITFWIDLNDDSFIDDGELFKMSNDSIIDLDEYDD